MAEDQSDNDLIERYLLGKLSPEETEAFKIRLDDDRELARKFRMIQMFPEMMSESAKQELEQRKALSSGEEKKEVKKSVSGKKILKIIIPLVASILLAGLIFIILSKNKKEEQPVQNAIIKSAETVPVKKDTVVRKVEEKTPETIPAEKPVIKNDIFPSEGSNVLRSQKIVFKWTNPVDTFSKITIVNETTGKTVLWRGLKPGMSSLEIPENHFFEGKYYWFTGNSKDFHHFTVTAE